MTLVALLRAQKCRSIAIGFCSPVALLASTRTYAQDAAIVGAVTDDSGAVLPGVSVTASSPALQVGSITVVTDEHGEYRITPVPVGTYSVAYALSGFTTTRRADVVLTASFVAKLDVKLRVGDV